MSTRRLFLPTVPITFFVLLFGLSAYLGSGITYDPALVGDSLSAVLLSVVLFVLVAYLVRGRYVARYLSLILIQLGTVFALLFISQFQFQNYPEMSDFIRRLGDATSILPNLHLGYLHPNAAATILEVVLPMAVAFALARRGIIVRVVGGLVSLIVLYAIFLTYSRGAYVGLVGAFLALLAALLLSRLPRPVAYTTVGIGVLVALAGVIFLFQLNPAQPLPILNRAVDPRLVLYHNSLYLARDYAVTGIGMGSTFAAAYSRYTLLIQPLFVEYASNLLLSIWLNQGLLGLLAFLGVIFMFYRYVAHIIRNAQPSIMFHGLWVGVTATLIHGLFDARQYTESALVMPVLFIAMGLAVAYGQIALRDEAVWLSIRRWLRGGLKYQVPVLVVLFIVLLIFSSSLTATWYTNQGAMEEIRADFAPRLTGPQRRMLDDAAIKWYEEALKTQVDYAPANRRLGNLYVDREQFEQAVPFLERAYAGEPTYPAAIKGLGLAYVWVGRTQEAADILKQMPSTEDMSNELYTWGYFRSGEEQQQPLLAAYAWETAEYMGSAGNIDVWMQIADFYQQADVLDRARAAYEHVLALDSNYQAALDGLTALDA